MIRYITALTSLLLLVSGLVLAQDRDTKVHNDRKEVQATGLWIYNDLPKGIAEAKETGRPLLIVFR
jgi:hypothetical protein